MNRFAPTGTLTAGLLFLAACGGTQSPDTETPEAVVETAPAAPLEFLTDVSAGAYSVEKTHAFLTFKIGHANGLSDYRVTFTDFDMALNFDTVAPENSSLTVTVNPLGVETNYPGDYKAGHADSPFETWEEDLSMNEGMLNAGNFPEIAFQSTSISMSGEKAGQVTGDLTFLGVTNPVTFDVTFNGSGNATWFGERDLIGFDASGTINRSDFGMTSMQQFLTDAVKIEFSGEFLQDE